MFNINSTLSRRNFLAGAAALGSTVALAGCSSGGSDDGSADDGKSFKIGVIGPLTGAAATYGVSVEKGAKLAVKDFSTKDLKLSLKSEDDVADGEKAINAFNTLCDWGMQALVGPVTTGAAVAVSGEIADDMLMVTPSASSLDVTKDKTTVFQVCFTDPTMGTSAAKFLAEKYADAKIALFYNSGDTYSSGVADAFAEQGHDLALVDVKGDVLDGVDGAVPDVDVVDGKHRLCHLVLPLILLAQIRLDNGVVVLDFLGRAIMAVRDNKIAAESVGISVTQYRMIAFVVSAALAGAAGALFGGNFSQLSATKFDFNTSILILVFVVLGGLGNMRGSVIAAALLTVLPELLRQFSDYRMLIYAIVLILVMVFTNNPQLKAFFGRVKDRLAPKKEVAADAQ